MDDALTFLPLGGVGEIGMNGLAVTWRGRRWLVDCGVMFPDDAVASTELVLPDLAWFEAEAERFAGMVLTHGHEDHIGAVPFVLKRCPMPVYGSEFTLALVRRKLDEHGLGGKVDLRVMEPAGRGGGVVRPPETPELGFSFLRVTHSIPDAASLVIETPHGTVLHTGDFKIDEEPMDGEHFDRDGFRRLGDRGVLLMLSDSTNAQVPGRTRSERSVVTELERRIAGWPGRVLVTQFASNLHRLRGLQEVARRNGRRLCLVGRSFVNYMNAARAAGLASLDETALLDVDALDRVAPHEALVVLTGSQGERRASLYRAAAGEHSALRIGREDLVLMSARIIPGNEKSIFRVVNNLARLGATVVHAFQAPIHTSGHARQEELREMIDLVRPRCFVPVHGEMAFLIDHEKIARAAGVPKTLLVENGQEFAVAANGDLSFVREVRLREHFFDGVVSGDGDELGLGDRQKMFHNGMVAAHVALTRHPKVLSAVVDLQSRGVFTDDGRHLDRAANEVASALADLPVTATEADLEDLTSTAVRRYFRRATGKKPTVVTFVTEAAAT